MPSEAGASPMVLYATHVIKEAYCTSSIAYWGWSWLAAGDRSAVDE